LRNSFIDERRRTYPVVPPKGDRVRLHRDDERGLAQLGSVLDERSVVHLGMTQRSSASDWGVAGSEGFEDVERDRRRVRWVSRGGVPDL
jgi:hypothetical protein